MSAARIEALSVSPHPEEAVLASGLNTILADRGPVTVLARKTNPYASRSRSEIVTCSLGDNSPLKLFVKYGTRDNSGWNPVAYEAEFYSRILEPLHAAPTKFYGAYTEAENARTWLVLQFIDSVMTLDDVSDAASMEWAATWLGHFHGTCDSELSRLSAGFLKTYDAGYYVNFAKCVVHAIDDASKYSWLRPFERAFEQFVTPLLNRRPSITHGDYYLHNILYGRSTLYPIDWEYGGLEAGELDLACLFDCWPEKVASSCALAYADARWPGGAPEDFGQVLDAARIAICCHNVGRHSDWTRNEEAVAYCGRLRRMAEELELL